MLIHKLIQKIADLQNTADRRYFVEGIFESSRENNRWFYARPDTNIFFTALIVKSLQKNKDHFPVNSLPIVEEIIQKGIANYPDFQNKDGLKTYNFFKTKPSQHFPNGHLLKRFEHFKIPDDADDTAFIYQTLPHSQSDALWLQQKLASHANLSQKQNTHTFTEYKALKAYSTWFGKNMYIEFDVCVLCNVLSCLLSFNLPLDQHGFDSLKYIKAVILSGQHLSHPFKVAHQYPRSVLIIYHVVRFIDEFQVADLEELRPILIKNCLQLLSKRQHWLDEILLLISLLKLDKNYQKQFRHTINRIKSQIEESLVDKPDFGDFYYFIAGMLTAFENPFTYAFAKSKWFHIFWKCDAFNFVLMLEFLVEIEKFERSLK